MCIRDRHRAVVCYTLRKTARVMLNPALQDFWFDGEPAPENYIKARNRVLYGGRASSKSWEFAGMAQHIAATAKTRFLCVRRFQNKIKDSVYTLIAAQIDNFKSQGFNVMATEIHHVNGSDFTFYGIERNTDEIKSFEGADVLLSLIHISEPTRLLSISYAVFCLKKK